MKRRHFILTAAGITGLSLMKTTASPKQPAMTLVHHVFFWLQHPGSMEDRDQLIEGLRTLAAIETVQKLHIAVPADTEKREVVDASWQVSELMFFADAAAQKVYQDHPIHQAFVQKYSHLWKKVVVYDAIEV